MKQILRMIDRWRFEAPLALVLAAAACFAMLAMPRHTFASVPVAGHLGHVGQIVLAAVAALVAGGLGYFAMRPRAAGSRVIRVKPMPLQPEIEAEEESTPVRTERLRRVRRADAHPDAPPREPIRASRDLGEPFMDVRREAPESFGQKAAAPIPEGDFSEIESADPVPPAHEPDVATEWAASEEPAIEPMVAEVHDDAAAPIRSSEAPVEAEQSAPVVEEAPAELVMADVVPAETVAIVPPVAPPAPVAAAPSIPAQSFRTGRESLDAMMDRLSAGMERRAGEPPRLVDAGTDPRAALRDALDELNRLATQRS